MTKIPLSRAGRGTVIGLSPQTTRTSSPETISAPMVIKIWRRWSLPTGRMTAYSKKSPAISPNRLAAAIAAKRERKLRARESAPTHAESAASTEAAMKAPKEMKAEWPKLRTFISPKTRLSPDAMRKIIMPMARPATVSVTHEENEPTSGSASTMRMIGRA